VRLEMRDAGGRVLAMTDLTTLTIVGLPGNNLTPPLDALQEVKVANSNTEATVGTYGGAQVNAYVKSATNALHGAG